MAYARWRPLLAGSLQHGDGAGDDERQAEAGEAE